MRVLAVWSSNSGSSGEMPAYSALQGVIPIVPTPFRIDESIDFEALAACVRFAIACQLPAICLPAYASEFYKLNEAERNQVVETAITTAGGKIGVVAQCNHPSARYAADLAQRYESMGAGVVSFALPRQFHLKEQDLLDYARCVCRSTHLPVLVQDFHPGGDGVGAGFAERLHQACPNFRYLKLELPLMGPKVRSIIRATGGGVGVLGGWGGMYLMELIRDGISGVMPGLGAADVLQSVWNQAYAGCYEVAMDAFQSVLPQLVYSLQNLELWLFAEKKLLAARGIIPEASSFVRSGSRAPEPSEVRHMLWLNERLIRQARRMGLTHP